MSDTTKSARPEIYPYNIAKAEALAAALGMSQSQMVNYLIEAASVEQITTLKLVDNRTKQVVTSVRKRRSDDSMRGYDPLG